MMPRAGAAYSHNDIQLELTLESIPSVPPYTGTAVVYAHIEPGVRLISTIFHPAESVSAVISSTVRSFASNMPIICRVRQVRNRFPSQDQANSHRAGGERTTEDGDARGCP